MFSSQRPFGESSSFSEQVNSSGFNGRFNPSELASDCIYVEVATGTIICTCSHTLGISFVGVAASTAVLSLGVALTLPLIGYGFIRWAATCEQLRIHDEPNTQLATAAPIRSNTPLLGRILQRFKAKA